MSRFGFLGPMYQSQSPLLANESCINWYFEQAESPNSRTPGALYPTPGLSLFATLKAGLPSVRGSLIVSGRRFFVAGSHLFEVSGVGAVTDYGDNATANNNMLDDGLPAAMVAGGTVGGGYPTQILIASGGALTVFSLATNTFQVLTTPPTNVQDVEFLDGFFIALSTGGAQPNSFSVSAVEDATTWPGISVSQVAVFSDQLLSMIVSNRLLWVFGAKRAVCYYNSGAPLFPFDVVSGGFLEVGIQAQFSVARVATRAGTTIAWLGGDERGANIVYLANGFTPTRVSDHGLEYFLSKNTTFDAVGIARQDQGHNFYDLWFPTANVTWTLDVDNGWWHQRSSLVGGKPAAHRGRTHIYDGTQHLVGDRTSGNVYIMDVKFFNENVGVGVFNPIIRTRVGPSIAAEGGQQVVPINEFQIDIETGVGPQPPLTDAFGQPRDPYVSIAYSENFGRTFGAERMLPIGQAGKFAMPVIDRRLGAWRSWTPRVVFSDPVPARIVDAYVNGTADVSPRLAKQFAKIA